MTNESTQLARTVVQTLISAGVTDVVLAPGSRNAPLSIAIAQAAEVNAIRLHVRIDERDAGFLALGIAKASGKQVAVIVTSGSAVANLVPAVVEAYYSNIGLVVVSADRPARQRGIGAPQTIDQSNIFGRFVTGMCDVAAGPDAQQVLADTLSNTGPVQLNVQFDLPLVPTDTWSPHIQSIDVEEVIGTQADHLLSLVSAVKERDEHWVPAHGLMVIGDVGDPLESLLAAHIAHELGWPIIWEPTSNVHSARNGLSHGVLVLEMPEAQDPDVVVTLGAVGLSRAVLTMLKKAPKHIAIASGRPDEPNPTGTASLVVADMLNFTTKPDPEWFAAWKSADNKASIVVERHLSSEALNGPNSAVTVWKHAGENDQLFIAASWSVRHLEAFAEKRFGLATYGNRGTNGIDGLISTAWGIALTSPERTYALMGDIAFLHDVGGLNVGPDEVKPNLTIVVLDNDGGGIFHQLEQGAPEYSAHFERIFGTPQGRDLWVVAEAMGIPATRVTTQTELKQALSLTDRIPGVHVIVCSTGKRTDENQLIADIKFALKKLR